MFEQNSIISKTAIVHADQDFTILADFLAVKLLALLED